MGLPDPNLWLAETLFVNVLWAGHVQIVVSLWVCMRPVGLSLNLSCSLCGALQSSALTIVERIPGPRSVTGGSSSTLGVI